MPVLGCLLVLFLPVLGAIVGHWIEGIPGSYWGAGIGFVLMLVASGGLFWLLRQLKS